MTERLFDALCLDLDGTLLSSQEVPHPKNLEALRALQQSGVQVMVVTGRSKIATLPVLDQLGLDSMAVVFNGAAVYCPKAGRLVEERTLSSRVLDRLLEFSESCGDMTLVMTADQKRGLQPRSEEEARSLDGLLGVEFVERSELRMDYTIRVTFISSRYSDSEALVQEVEDAVGLPIYTTHFPLCVLPRHKESRMHAVDVQPPCAGKAEALRVLREVYDIPSERVVAVGDATNDLPMIQAAGLGVAMGNSMPQLKAVADRVIGHHDGTAIADLVQELFPSTAGARG